MAYLLLAHKRLKAINAPHVQQLAHNHLTVKQCDEYKYSSWTAANRKIQCDVALGMLHTTWKH